MRIILLPVAKATEIDNLVVCLLIGEATGKRDCFIILITMKTHTITSIDKDWYYDLENKIMEWVRLIYIDSLWWEVARFQSEIRLESH